MRDIIDEIITKIEAEVIDTQEQGVSIDRISAYNNGLNKALEIVNVHKKPESWKLAEDKMSEVLGQIQKSVDSGKLDFDYLGGKLTELRDLNILIKGEGFDETN